LAIETYNFRPATIKAALTHGVIFAHKPGWLKVLG